MNHCITRIHGLILIAVPHLIATYASPYGELLSHVEDEPYQEYPDLTLTRRSVSVLFLSSVDV
jgi:hypothetical protein